MQAKDVYVFSEVKAKVLRIIHLGSQRSLLILVCSINGRTFLHVIPLAPLDFRKSSYFSWQSHNPSSLHSLQREIILRTEKSLNSILGLKRNLTEVVLNLCTLDVFSISRSMLDISYSLQLLERMNDFSTQ